MTLASSARASRCASSSSLVASARARRTSSADTVIAGTAGLYAARLAFDASGNVAGLEAPPSFLVSLGKVPRPEGEVADARLHSWSPDMSRVACDHHNVQQSRVGLRVIDVVTGAVAVIVADARVADPDWATDGSRIAYSVGAAIETVTPDGADRRTVATGWTNDGLRFPRFSPDSASIAFLWDQWQGLHRVDVARVGASGGKVVNLTRDVDPWASPIDWR